MNQATDTPSEATSTVAVDYATPADTARARPSILLVDDQPARLLTYEAILASLDVECVRALSGREALKQLLSKDFALILLDVNMPEMDGFETARLIREHPRWERTPIIFATGINISNLDQLRGYQAGAIDYIPVPVVPEILRSKVAVLAELHQRRRSLEAANTSLTQARAELELRHASAIAERDAQLHAIREAGPRANDDRKDEFLAMLSHELRNPAAAIGNAAQALARLVADRDKERALVGIVDRQIRHLRRLLDDLLDVARITQGRIEIYRERLTLQSCIELALETTQSLIDEKDHRLAIDARPEPLWVNADKVRFAQCISNLLTNAAKYTERGGHIHVRAFIEGGTAVVEIADSGIGMPAELIPRVFELFVQGERGLDRAQGGLGVGLAVCRRLMELQEGSVTGISPGIGKGSTFTLRVPLAGETLDVTSIGTDGNGSRARVLIVDDNRDAADSLALLLQLEDHATLTAYCSADALTQAVTFDPQFVLLDIGLPEMDGYEVARRLKTMVPHARLIAISGYGLTGDKQRSANSGFEAHLVKPVNLTDLHTAFASLTR